MNINLLLVFLEASVPPGPHFWLSLVDCISGPALPSSSQIISMSARSDASASGSDSPSPDPNGDNITQPAAPNPNAALQVDVRFHPRIRESVHH